jgi:hypothetical protein
MGANDFTLWLGVHTVEERGRCRGERDSEVRHAPPRSELARAAHERGRARYRGSSRASRRGRARGLSSTEKRVLKGFRSARRRARSKADRPHLTTRLWRPPSSRRTMPRTRPTREVRSHARRPWGPTESSRLPSRLPVAKAHNRAELPLLRACKPARSRLRLVARRLQLRRCSSRLDSAEASTLSGPSIRSTPGDPEEETIESSSRLVGVDRSARAAPRDASRSPYLFSARR